MGHRLLHRSFEHRLQIPPKSWSTLCSVSARQGTHLIAILTIIAPLIIAAVPARPSLTEEDIRRAIVAVVDAPLTTPPLRLRRAAYEILVPHCSSAPKPQEKEHVLACEALDLLLRDNEAFFVDEGRILDGIVLDHDWEMAKRLVKLLNKGGLIPETREAYLEGLVLLLRASRHIAELAVYDAHTVFDGATSHAARDASELKKARAQLGTADNRLKSGLDALGRGDADSAIQHFRKAWAFADSVLGVWAIEFAGDHDQDGLLDILEMRIGSSVFATDSDDDGLSDAYEFYSTMPYLMPNSPDTDDDGIPDGEEDLDEDGLRNIDEFNRGTDPLVGDTDGDGLDDGFEASNVGLDPLAPDSDADQLADGSELRLGTNPQDPDSDADGILDGADSHFQVVAAPDLGVSVELEGVGDHSEAFRAHSLAGVGGLSEVPGLIGDFIDLSSSLPLVSAIVRMSFDANRVPGGDFGGLRIVRYDFDEKLLQLLPDQSVDMAAHEVSARTSELSAFGVVYLPEWELEYASVGQAATPNGASPKQALLGRREDSLLQVPAQDEESPSADSVPSETPTAEPAPTLPSAPPPEAATILPEETPTPQNEEPIRPPVAPGNVAGLGAEGPGITGFESSEEDGAILISDGPQEQHAVAIAYNQADRLYLAIWVDQGEAASLRARAFDEFGSPLGAEFIVALGTAGVPIRPDVVYNEVENSFLVLWSEANGGQSVETYCLSGSCLTYTQDTYNLNALPLDAQGTPIASAPHLITEKLTFWSWVEMTPAYDVAFNPAANEYLAIWHQPRGGFIGLVAHPHRVLGVRLDSLGAPKGAPTTLVEQVVSSLSLAYNRIRNEYLFTFDRYLPAEYELFAGLVGADDLAMLGAGYNLSGLSPGHQLAAGTTYDGSTDRFLIAWWDNRANPGGWEGPANLVGQVVEGSGAPFGPNQVLLDPEDPSEKVELWEPRLAFSPVEGRHLVSATYGQALDLHGRYIASDGIPEGDAFRVTLSAFQGGVAARVGGQEQAPRWFVTWTHDADIYGRLYPVPLDVDSDFDGLTDQQEAAGFRTQFGNRVFTDPFNDDTDGDGLPDGDEIGTQADGRYRILSDPTRADTDSDGLEDYVELRDLEQPLNPFDPDEDDDGLLDGQEVNEYTTDPREGDSDGDGVRDGEEVNKGQDPLLPTERMEAHKVVMEFFLGALCGEFCLDDHGNMAFFAGFLISGAISVIPSPVTTVVGLIADLRDFTASLVNGDWSGLALNTLALLPWAGDVADVLGSVGKFVARHVGLVAEVSALTARLDWLPDAARLGALRMSWGDDVLEALAGVGFDGPRALRLAKAGVNLSQLLEALRPLLDAYPGIADFLRAVPIEDLTGILRGNGLTANLKALADAQQLGRLRSVAGFLANIRGAYTQWLMRADRLADGWQVMQDLRHVSAAGYDLIVQQGGIVRLMEAKSGQVTLAALRNYFRRGAAGLRFNKGYFLRNFGKQFGEEAATSVLLFGNFEIEIFLNNPASQKIAQELLESMGGAAVRYLDEQNVLHEVRVILTAIHR